MSASRASRPSGRIAIAAVFSALLLPALTAVAVAVAAPAAGSATKAAVPAKKASSWQVVRTEEFSGSSLPDACESYTNGDKYSAGKNAWRSDDVDVTGGLLKLKLEKKKTSGRPYSAGAIGCWNAPQKYGRFEIKAKVPAGAGINSSISLVPAKPSKSTTDAFTGMDLLGGTPQTAYVTNGYGTKSERLPVPGKYASAFHNYVIEWAPKHVRMTVDGKEMFYSHKSFKGSRWLGLVVTTGDKLTGLPKKTSLPARLQIDRVRISKYTGVAPKYRAEVTSLTPVLSGAGTPTPSPGASSPAAAAKVPAKTGSAPITALEKTSASSGPALAGGIWPWLLGGSLIAVFAVASLNYPHYRRNHPVANSRPAPGNGRASYPPDRYPPA